MSHTQQSAKMWSGRFREPLDATFESWQRSFPFDWRLVPYEVEASIAHAQAIEAAGILTSEMFGFRSDLDPETLADLDNRVRLVAKEASLSPQEMKELEEIDKRLVGAGFSKEFSDPYYAAFVRAWGRRHSELMAGQQFQSTEERQEVDRIAQEVLEEAVSELDKESKH